MTSPIPFNRAVPIGREVELVGASMASGRMSALGPYTAQVAELLAAETGAAEVLLTTSCTAALELAALLLDLEPGDAVVVPSFTFSTSALAFARAGAAILFADIEPTTLGIDPASVATLLGRAADAGLRVRAVVAVHYAGVGCRVDDLLGVLAGHPDVALVEDNAHGLFGAVGERPLGSFGRFATQSFHDTKNFSCGEGGALLLNDPADLDRARVLHEKGTNRRAFMLGQVDKYTWVDTGSSFGLSDALAAFLLGQLEQRASVQERRRALAERYAAALAPHADELGLTLPVTPPGHTSAAHLFHVLLPTREIRDGVLARMHEEQVNAVFHYVPLHDSVAGRRFAGLESACPVSVDVSGRLLRLPFFTTLPEAEADRVVEVFLAAARAAQSGGAR